MLNKQMLLIDQTYFLYHLLINLRYLLMYYRYSIILQLYFKRIGHFRLMNNLLLHMQLLSVNMILTQVLQIHFQQYYLIILIEIILKWGFIVNSVRFKSLLTNCSNKNHVMKKWMHLILL